MGYPGSIKLKQDNHLHKPLGIVDQYQITNFVIVSLQQHSILALNNNLNVPYTN